MFVRYLNWVNIRTIWDFTTTMVRSFNSTHSIERNLYSVCVLKLLNIGTVIERKKIV